MTIRNSLVLTLVAAVMMLSACAKNETQKSVEKGNSIQREMNAIAEALEKEGIYILKPEASVVAIASADGEKLVKNRRLLNRYVGLGQDLLKIVKRKDIRYSGTEDNVKTHIKNARALRKVIDERLGKGRDDRRDRRDRRDRDHRDIQDA